MDFLRSHQTYRHSKMTLPQIIICVVHSNLTIRSIPRRDFSSNPQFVKAFYFPGGNWQKRIEKERALSYVSLADGTKGGFKIMVRQRR